MEGSFDVDSKLDIWTTGNIRKLLDKDSKLDVWTTGDIRELLDKDSKRENQEGK